MKWKDIKETLIGKGLPLLGGVFGGSAGEKIGEGLAGALGCDPTPEAINDAINDPEKLLQLKKYEMDHKKELEQIQLEETFAYLADVQAARSREIEIARVTGKRDINLYVLAWTIVIGFFGLMGILIFRVIPTANSTILNLVVGALLGSFTTVIGYFFGSSKSSTDKTKLLGGKNV